MFRAPGIVLIDPKFPHNVGATIRACSCFGVDSLVWTGSRIELSMYQRLPREERMNSRFAKCKFGLHLVQSKEIMSCSGTTTVACYPRLDDNWRTHVTHCTAPDAVEPACRRIVKPGRTGWLPTFHSGQDRRQYPCVRRPRACANGSLCETTLSSS